MWRDLTMRQKADLMKLGVQNGVTDLNQIKRIYNIYADGGYLEWKEQIRRHKGLNIDDDNTYDYKGFFESDPERAWNMLNEGSDAHFIDDYKTVYHPTFSTQSIYSGRKHPVFNPGGLKGGTWSRDGKAFTMSDDLYRGPVSMDDRISYLSENEDNGVQLFESDGSYPVMMDGALLGPVLPTVHVQARKERQKYE